MLTVTGSPVAPFADAIFARLSTDTVLLALTPGGVYASLPRSTRATPPYVVVGRREQHGSGFAMQIGGGDCHVFIDVWSLFNGPSEAETIQSRIRVLLERQPLAVAGFVVFAGSVSCEEEFVLQEFDSDMPERTLFHGVQHWSAALEESL